MRRLHHVVDDAVGFAARAFVGDRRAPRPLLALVVTRQIRADLPPRLAAVVRSQQHVAAVIDHRGIKRRDADRSAPVEAVLLLAWRDGGRHLRPCHDISRRLRLVVELADDAHVAAGVDIARLVGVERRHRTLAAAHVVPVTLRDPARRGAGDLHGGVVLLAAVHVVREKVVHRDAVELRGRLVALRRPGAAAVERDVGAAVVAFDDRLGIARVDPEAVVIAVGRPDAGDALAAVDRLADVSVEHPHHVGVLRVRDDLHVVPGARVQCPGVVHQLPRLRPIIRAVQATLRIGFDHGVEAVGVGRDVDADFTDRRGQAVHGRLPGRAAVGGFMDPAAGATASYFPGPAQVIPHRRVEDSRVGGIHGEL